MDDITNESRSTNVTTIRFQWVLLVEAMILVLVVAIVALELPLLSQPFMAINTVLSEKLCPWLLSFSLLQ